MEISLKDRERTGQLFPWGLEEKISILTILRFHICLISFRPNQKKNLNGQTLCHGL